MNVVLFLALAVAGAKAERPGVNVCLAVDRSASMMGEKMASARTAAVAALERLGPSDVVSVIAYDDVVELLAPATRVAARPNIEPSLRALRAGGGGALYAGVVKCAAELRKFGSGRQSRIVLFSHGRASVGPGSPAELGALGAALADERISVVSVALGAGFDEGTLGALARRSEGGVVRLERPEDLDRVLDDQLAPLPVPAHVAATTSLRPAIRRPRLVPTHARAEKVDTGARNFVHAKKVITMDPLDGLESVDDLKL